MGKSGKLGQALIGIVAEGKNGRAYLAPDLEQERIAFSEKPKTRPTQMQPDNPRWFSPPDYGMESFGDLFTDRQMIAVTRSDARRVGQECVCTCRSLLSRYH